ncbi:hypothetical protein JCM16408A_46970 [Methylobacterium phyllosphaerae]
MIDVPQHRQLIRCYERLLQIQLRRLLKTPPVQYLIHHLRLCNIEKVRAIAPEKIPKGHADACGKLGNRQRTVEEPQLSWRQRDAKRSPPSQTVFSDIPQEDILAVLRGARELGFEIRAA